jgi:hypothetical protein
LAHYPLSLLLLLFRNMLKSAPDKRSRIVALELLIASNPLFMRVGRIFMTQ